MANIMPQKPAHNNDLTRDIRAFMIKRDKMAETSRVAEHKSLDTQVLLGELENLIKSMDQGDARVQRMTAKLQELKTAIL